jgi:hypothetical protein
MTRPNLKAERVLEWGDGEYLFALKGAQLEHLEKACDAPIGQIAARLFSQMPGYADVREVIHQGLIGGGMPPVEATRKMKAYFEGQPLDGAGDPSSPLKTAIAVMSAAWFGVGDLPKGEAPAGESPAKSTSGTTEPLSSKEA